MRRALQGAPPAGGSGPNAAERPTVMFLDEPTSGLDPMAAARGAQPDLRAPAAGSDDLSHHPPARRGRETLRPGGHHEQRHCALLVDTGGVARPAFREIAARHHTRAASMTPSQAVQSCINGVESWRAEGPGFLCAFGLGAEGGGTRGGAGPRPCRSRCPLHR